MAVWTGSPPLASGFIPRPETGGALEDHRDSLTACLNLAHAYYGVGRRSDAVRLLTAIIERCEQNLRAGDPLTATARASLANITGTG